MKISLTDNKKEKMKHYLEYSLQNSNNLSVEYVAKIIGYMISSLLLSNLEDCTVET